MARKIIMSMVLIVMALGLVACDGVVGCDGLIDPNVSFGSLEEVQAVLSDDFYFFDFDDQTMQSSSYQAKTNTQSGRRRRRGDFEYIGYFLGFWIIDYNSHFYVSAIQGKNLDGLIEKYKKDVDSNIEERTMMIDGIECIFISRVYDVQYELYFMLNNVRYYFNTNGTSEAMFLSVCESAIQSKYKAK